jgi:ABC-type sugar transport system ATPase subunit
MVDTPVVENDGLTKWFGANLALDGATFELRRGEIHALVGVNGAGKSTMMKIIAGVHSMDSGAFRLEGTSVTFTTPLEAEQHGISIRLPGVKPSRRSHRY